MMVMLFGFATQTFAQDKKDDGFRIVENVKETKVNLQTNLAKGLVEYGYENKSAISLVQAAEIFAKHPIIQLAMTEEDGKPVEEVAPTYSYDPQVLLADAKIFAKKDAELLVVIGKKETEINTQTKSEVMAGGAAATISLGSGKTKTITLDVKPVSYNRLHARTGNYADLQLCAWTVWEDKGCNSGTRPSLSFAIGASSRITVSIKNLEDSPTTVELFLESIGVEDLE